MIKNIARTFVLVAGAICLVLGNPAAAQQPQQAQPKPSKAAPAAPKPAAAAAPAPAASVEGNAQSQPVWTSRCASEGRKSALLCEVEQSLYMTKTGQLVASVNVKLPADTRQPVMMIQLPVGLFLPAGVTFQVDEGKPQALAIQTCDLKGCYAATPLSPDILTTMTSGKRLSVVFQNLNKENVNLAFVLSGFAEGYDKIN
ncbi:invasion associated locus B family protein [Tardiphaga alba]|uniref:Invasion associated locus B family protein n=2 Tax=Tardiphaga alba TaxID=340268 RepID=A0ABX8AIR8_9BRAD|nr:invasion associated locus B family protein [Tardiphaga alba]